MARVFNMGLGMIVVVAPENVAMVEQKTPAIVQVGKVIKHEDGNIARVEWAANGEQ
jgi:phosphoribosylaminoimidazole (AIR) synthetase